MPRVSERPCWPQTGFTERYLQQQSYVLSQHNHCFDKCCWISWEHVGHTTHYLHQIAQCQVLRIRYVVQWPTTSWGETNRRLLCTCRCRSGGRVALHCPDSLTVLVHRETSYAEQILRASTISTRQTPEPPWPPSGCGLASSLAKRS